MEIEKFAKYLNSKRVSGVVSYHRDVQKKPANSQEGFP